MEYIKINKSNNFVVNLEEIPESLNQQTIQKEKVKNIEESFSNFKDDSVYSIIKNAQKVDDALINSIMAYSVYSRNLWMIDSIGNDFDKMKDKFSEAFFSSTEEEAQKKFFNLKIWNFINNTFEKVQDSKIRIPAQNMALNDYQYVSTSTYKDGQFNARNANEDFQIAHANIMKRKNPNGEGYILHLTYRGTEFEHLWQYIKGPYLDMNAYYENFKPLEKHIKQFVSDPKNQITELQVSGHSLGGAMVQQFLKNNPKEEFPVPIKGFTFGSPGSKKNKFHKFLTNAFHSIFRGIELQEDKFKDNVKDKRLQEFFHNNDPIPKIGLLGYKRNGETYNLFDTVKKETELAKDRRYGETLSEKLPVFGKCFKFFKELTLSKFTLSFHDNDRYIINLRNVMEDYFVAYPNIGNILSENLPNLSKWTTEERSFMGLSVKYKETFLDMIKEKFPDIDKNGLNKSFYSIREKMLLDTVSESVLAKTHMYARRPAGSFFRTKTDVEVIEMAKIDLASTVEKMRSKYLNTSNNPGLKLS